MDQVLVRPQLAHAQYLSEDDAEPLFHLGMSGSCGIKVGRAVLWLRPSLRHLQDGDSMVYRKKPKKALNENGEAWPPRCQSPLPFPDRRLIHSTDWKACLTFDVG